MYVYSNYTSSFLKWPHIHMMHKHLLIYDMNVFHSVYILYELIFDAYPLTEYPYSCDHLGFDATNNLYMSIYNLGVRKSDRFTHPRANSFISKRLIPFPYANSRCNQNFFCTPMFYCYFFCDIH